MNIGRVWSISRLLRHIAEQPDGIYLYVLADRYSKKRLPYLQELFDELPDFMLFQFKGYVPFWDTLDRENIKATYRRKCLPASGVIEPNTIEIGTPKMGDGVLAMTPAGAGWMQAACDLHLPGAPYEVALFQQLNTTEIGVYSTYDAYDETCEQNDYYGNYDRHAWEGQYPFGTPLGDSDIGKVNKIKDTGTYRDE